MSSTTPSGHPPSGYVSAAYLERMALLGESIKQTNHQRMNIQHGDCVLDLGCGPGIDTLALAQWVGPQGRVVGVDSDPEMVAAAHAKATEMGLDTHVEHHLGRAEQLAFGDGTFASSHAERLLQVLPSELASRVVAELKRVTRAGGRVVLADTDWGSLSINSRNSTLERRLVQFFAEQLRPNGYAGRQLFSLMRTAGFIDVDIHIEPLIHTTLDAVPLAWLYKEAKQGEHKLGNLATPTELDDWWHEVQSANENGTFFCTVNMVVVTGDVP
ncbi:MAG TPA: methyltransferase domain-containing protein [Marinagarivorans sp.]